ncbi:hypothetical protein SADUNF_Sadunf12G0020400 [Salix dunnii]|uniref:Uncharacterized protein n=1 Tax=Salix dunnii TaxID=1413687 RepID=A0A835JMC2_9ROSI|nr:hypothetical protein SADUNF_Sadunf12G0020400 [Salix dunnii]
MASRFHSRCPPTGRSHYHPPSGSEDHRRLQKGGGESGQVPLVEDLYQELLFYSVFDKIQCTVLEAASDKLSQSLLLPIQRHSSKLTPCQAKLNHKDF